MKFDVLVIGAGPAGLNAAQAAAARGATVAVVDDNARPGGQVWRHGPQAPLARPARALLADLAARAEVTLLDGTRVAQWLPERQVLAERAGAAMRIGYRSLVIATGARERFLPFPGWTLPGVTGAGGLQALVKGGTPVAGQRVVLAGSGPLLWAAAMTARAHGAQVAAIVEQAPALAVARFAASLARTPGKLLQAAHMRLALGATSYLCGAHVAEAAGSGRGERLERVRVRGQGGDRWIDCDRLACGYGLVPNTAIAAALGCRMQAQDGAQAILVDPWQATSVAGVFAAGECTGVGGMELSALEGRIAGLAATGAAGEAQGLFARRARFQAFARRMHEAFALNPALRTLAAADTLLCRCEDVSFAQAARHASWREAKLHTRCGMGPCQGKVCGPAAAFCLGWDGDGERSPRPPFVPVRIETLLQADEAGA